VSRRVLCIAIVGAAIALALAPVPPAFIERWYSRGLYAGLQPAITTASSWSPIALLDAAIALWLTALIVTVVRRWGRHRFLVAMRDVAVLLVVSAAACYLWFALVWGLNYRRVPLEQKIDYDAARITPERAMAFGRDTVARVNALQASDPLTLSSLDHADLQRAFADVTARLGASRPTRVASPKRSLLAWYFRKAAIDGMTDPFFLEIILNPDLLPFERPFVLAHEWAHLAGYADEAEANFIAWATCISSAPAARYSGWLSAYEHVANGLRRDERRALAASLNTAVIVDLVAASKRLERSSPAVRLAARGAYDTYLRANRVEEGIARYNAVVRLMLGASFDETGKPELRR
jgi:hypothetical protein